MSFEKENIVLLVKLAVYLVIGRKKVNMAEMFTTAVAKVSKHPLVIPVIDALQVVFWHLKEARISYMTVPEGP